MRQKISLPLIVLLVAEALLTGNAWAAQAGRVQFVNGDVQVTNAAGQVHAMQKGEPVNEGDLVVSAKDASAQIKMQDGGFVAIRPDTRLKFDSFKFGGKAAEPESSLFSLFKGGFRAITGLIGRIKHEDYKITTPVATIGIRGTDHETVVVLPNDPLAATGQAAPGTYNKVNVGETSITTDAGSVNVLPNQMGYAGAPDQVPQLQPINTNLFTVTPPPVPQHGNGNGSSGSNNETRDTAVVDNLGQHTEGTGTTGQTATPTTTTPPSVVTVQTGLPTTSTTTTTTTQAVTGPTVTPLASGTYAAGMAWGPAAANGGYPGGVWGGQTVTFDTAGAMLQVSNASWNLTTTTPQVAEFGADGIIAWGRWSSGTTTMTGLVSPNLITANYIAGVQTPTITVLKASYTVFASTAPTALSANGTLLTGSSNVVTGTITVNTISPTVTVSLNNITVGGQTFAISGSSGFFATTGFLIPGTVTSSTGGCGAGCAGNIINAGAVQGWFIGANGERAGLNYGFTSNLGNVSGAAVFK